MPLENKDKPKWAKRASGLLIPGQIAEKLSLKDQLHKIRESELVTKISKKRKSGMLVVTKEKPGARVHALKMKKKRRAKNKVAKMSRRVNRGR